MPKNPDDPFQRFKELFFAIVEFILAEYQKVIIVGGAIFLLGLALLYFLFAS